MRGAEATVVKAFALALVLLLGGGSITGVDGDDADVGVEAQASVLGVEANASSNATQGQSSIGLEDAGEGNATAQANLTGGDETVEVEADATEGEVNVSTSLVELVAHVGGGDTINLTFTPPSEVAVVDPIHRDSDESFEQPVESSGEQAASSAQEDEDAGTELAWTIAPVAGVAAAAAAGQALPITRWLRRLLGLAPAVPLFSRIPRDEVLDHPSREAIYELLGEEAGLSLETMCEQLGLARSTARHHVRKLEQAKMVEHTRVGRARVHHLVGQRREALVNHLLANGTRRDVYEQIEEEALTISEIARQVDVNPGSVHFHLEKLVDAGLVERTGEDRRRFVAREEPELVTACDGLNP